MIIRVNKDDPVDMQELAAMIRKGLREIELRFNGVDMRLDMLERQAGTIEEVGQVVKLMEGQILSLENKVTIQQRAIEFHEMRLRVGNL